MHHARGSCSHVGVRTGHRLDVTLDRHHAEKLRRLAKRTNVRAETLADFLLTTALDDLDWDAGDVMELLDGIDGAFERARQGAEQARTGRTVPLDEL